MRRHFLVFHFASFDCNEIRNRINEEFNKSKFLLNKILIFLNSKNTDDFLIKTKELSKSLLKFTENNNLILSIIPQSPVGLNEISIEMEFLDSTYEVSLNKFLSKNKMFEIQEIDSPVYQEIDSCINPLSYDKLQDLNIHNILQELLLQHFQSGREKIIRIWNFIGKITNFTRRENIKIQNYQEFNNARYNIFNYFKINDYPASTGIGMDFLPLLTMANSVNYKFDDKIYYLSNNNQTEAYNYSVKVLFGQDEQKKAPLFSRGLLFDDGETVQLYISGTSSILGEESIAISNLENATNATLENIEQVCDLGKISTLLKEEIERKNINFKFARIYLKKNEGFEKVKLLVQNYMPEACINLVIADICRPELLVEIEAYAEIIKNNT